MALRVGIKPHLVSQSVSRRTQWHISKNGFTRFGRVLCQHHLAREFGRSSEFVRAVLDVQDGQIVRLGGRGASKRAVH